MLAAEAAANKYIQERFVPKLVAAGIVVAVDIVRRPDEEAPQGAAIVKKADEIDAATIVVCPHEQDFKSEVMHSGSSACVHSSMRCSNMHGSQPWVCKQHQWIPEILEKTEMTDWLCALARSGHQATAKLVGHFFHRSERRLWMCGVSAKCLRLIRLAWMRREASSIALPSGWC